MTEVAELRRRLQHYEALFADNPHATFTLDATGTFVEANEVTQEISGYPLEQLRRLSFDRLLPADVVPDAAKAFADAWSREPQKVHTAMRTRTGEVLDLNVALVPVVVDGEVVAVHGVAEDMTVETGMRRDLEAARRTAEQADQAKSMFLANMSHEVRTPLTSILGNSELLADSDLDDDQRRRLEVVQRSALQLLRLVNDILDVSRLEAGKLTVTAEPMSVPALVEEVLVWAAPAADRAGLELVGEVEPDAPHRLRADPLRVTQVLTNLVGNAVKFTEAGSVRLLVSRAVTTSGEPAVRFVVADTGPGIDDGQLESLFESFTQADPTQTRRHGGAGLGLAICRELVELLGGRLEASSTPGVGSRFGVTLPLDAAPSRGMLER
ncbi:sensor histidine kinase [Nocardioides scoriae]|uniref:sensor histidine kinase n=1 Tax=Nocardioides scoriae TaxID=642780 RepID=UPI0012F796B3|nr:ATP-binding protein [Nocardioides scoriae]